MYENSLAAVSQDTLFSLQQIDPLPMESTLDLEKQDLPPPPTPSPLSRASTLGLSGGGHGKAYYLIRLQRYSSYVFTVYSAMHITNTSILPLFTQSVAAAENYLLLTRPCYQSPLLEPLWITIPLIVHVGSGALLRLHRRNAAIRRYGSASAPPTLKIESRNSTRSFSFWPVMSWASISGYMLTPLVLGHALVNRTLPWWIEGGSSGVGLQFVSHGFAKHPFVSWTGYSALVALAGGHITWGMAKWLNITPDGTDSKKSNRRWWAINAVSLVVVALWIGGGSVVFRGGKTEGWIGAGYDKIYAQIPLVSM